jgi:anti-anti-sigma regulatory factor
MCTAESATAVVLDLSEVSFIDTAGVRAIIACKEIFDEHDCGYWLLPPAADARRLLERYGVLHAMPLHEQSH